MIGIFITLIAVFTIITPWNKTNSPAQIKSFKVNGSTCEDNKCVTPAGEPFLVQWDILFHDNIENFKIHIWGIWSSEENRYVIDSFIFYDNLGPGRLLENFRTRSYCPPCLGVETEVKNLYMEIKSENKSLDNQSVSIHLTE